MNLVVYLIPLLPLLGFAILGLANRSLAKGLASFIGCGTIGISFVLSLFLFMNHETQTANLGSWFHAGNLNIDFSFLVDSLTKTFLLVITGVGFLIHVYSTGYMQDDDGYRRFFAYLNLFVFFMLVLVMGDSFVLMFVGWEGVGLCSYLLIGFWFKNIDYSNAAKKAFIVNRIGDLGFLIGMFLLFTHVGSLSYGKVLDPAIAGTISTTVITLATLFLFIGAMGKSAQIPLYTWLPDAMAGPTPVSALIHAATMVTAGIYMIARSHVLFSLAPVTLHFVLAIGLLTALMAASIGLYQNDIKKVLAYSTVSQLGLMFAALGVGAYTAGVFHVVTHAFFKALLFLGAGSVIHAMGGEQDIRKMGGLKSALPVTYITFFIGTLSIAGIPPFAGFFSKDGIYAELYLKGGLIPFIIGLAVTFMTTFYMFRLLFLTFSGSFRGTHEQEHHLHESPPSITIPLIVLAIFATIAGFIGIPHGIGASVGMHHWFDHYLSSVIKMGETEANASTEWILIFITLVVTAVALYLCYRKFKVNNYIPVADESMSGLPKTLYNKYYVDEAYDSNIRQPLDDLSHTLTTRVDHSWIDGVVHGVGSLVRWTGDKVRLAQNGNLGTYLLAMVIAMIIILIVSIF